MHVSGELVQEIQASSEESLRLKEQAAHFTRHCQQIEAHIRALQAENQRLNGMNALMESDLRREREKNEHLLSRCADQENILSCFRKDFPNLQNGMCDLLETWEHIGFTRAKE
jgi:septal ring factor EnvC (AmiA/AmiB activator)